EARHQLRIRYAGCTGGGIDARDPQLAKIAFAVLAAGIGEIETALHLLLGDAVTARLHPPIAFGGFQDLRAAILSLGTSFDSRHDSPFSILGCPFSGERRTANGQPSTGRAPSS